MADILTPDFCVIGAGSGGLAVAAAARAYGASVVLVEREKMGGERLNAGCIPSKALAAAARRAQALRTATPFGIGSDEPKVNFRGLHEHIHGIIDGIAANVSIERFEALGVEIVGGEAKFTDRRTVVAGETTIRARRFVIATGSRPAIPRIQGLDTVPYFTSDTIFENTRKLSHLVIIGGGPTGLELAQAYRRLGSDVTVIDKGPMLPDSDPELVEIALRRMIDEGVSLRPETEVTSITLRSMGIGVTVKSGETAGQLDASHILVATGRVANLDDLDLEKARIRHQKGDVPTLVVSSHLLTSNPKVYAIGDAAGGPQQTSLAVHQARQIVDHALLGRSFHNTTELVPTATFTDPEIAEVGITEPLAKKRLKTRYTVTRASFAENDRARTERQGFGVAKMITAGDGRILGAGIVGPEAAELIALFSFAVANKLKAETLSAFVAPYPTLSEIARQLGEQYLKGQGQTPWVKRRLALNRLLR
jgi:pyruvate/2-oxoglutarate dehydrogenase complex dihydrolipoamide dehydrogenase (E3) component